MGTTVIKLSDKKLKFGLVTVRNKDGSLNRQFKITPEEYTALAGKGALGPHGVTEEEWINGLAFASGISLEEGDAELRSNGSVLIKVRENLSLDIAGKITETYVELASSDYTGILPAITIKPASLSSMDQAKASTKVLSIVDGVITWQ